MVRIRPNRSPQQEPSRQGPEDDAHLARGSGVADGGDLEGAKNERIGHERHDGDRRDGTEVRAQDPKHPLAVAGQQDAHERQSGEPEHEHQVRHRQPLPDRRAIQRRGTRR